MKAARRARLIAPGDTLRLLGDYSLRFHKRRVAGTGSSPWSAPEEGANPRLVVAASGGNAADITQGQAYVNYLEEAPSVSFGIQNVPQYRGEGRRQDALLYFLPSGPKLVAGRVDTYNSFLSQPVRVRVPRANEQPSGSPRIVVGGWSSEVATAPAEQNTAITASCLWVRGSSKVTSGQEYQYALVVRW